MPSKKLILIFTLLIAAGGGFWIYKNKPWHDSGLVYDPQAAVKAAQTSRTADANLDTDGDGLKDWQEILFKLDPANPDTDGDGILDGNEEASEVLSISESRGGAPDESGRPPNISQEFARDAAMGYWALKSSGLDDESIFNTLLGGFGKKYDTARLFADVFKEEDVIKIPDTQEEIRRYANSVAEVFDSAFQNLTGNEMELLGEIINGQSGARSFDVFSDYRSAYTQAAERLRKLSTPDSYTAFHADLINNFYNLALINEAFSKSAEDPLGAFLHLVSYQKEAERFRGVMFSLTGKLLNDKIVFSSDDSGRQLFSYSAGAN